MLEINDATLKIGNKTIVQDINIKVSPGELVVICGPNGAGKSTTLKLFSGEHKPDQGEVLIDGVPLQHASIEELAKQKAILSQNTHLSFAFTVMEVVLLVRYPHEKTVTQNMNAAIAMQAMKKADILYLKDRIYLNLSGGEKQRVQLARVLAQIWEKQNLKSRYLLLDEPTSNLDLAHQYGTMKLARDFSRDGVGVIAVLHDLNLAAAYADRIILLNNGKMVIDDSPDVVFCPKLIEDVFRLPVSIYSGDHRHVLPKAI